MYSSGQEPSEGTLVDLASTATSYIPNVTKGTTYYLSVRAQTASADDAGYGEFFAATTEQCSAATADVKPAGCGTLAISLPGAPTGLTLALAGSTLQVSWTRPADTGTGDASYLLTNYLLEITNQTAFPGTTLITKDDGDLAHAETSGLTLGVTYFARIRATNAAGAGAWSNVHGEVSQLQLLVPSVPLSLEAAYASDASGTVTALLSWATPSDTGAGDATFALTAYNFSATPTSSQNAAVRVDTLILLLPLYHSRA